MNSFDSLLKKTDDMKEQITATFKWRIENFTEEFLEKFSKSGRFKSPTFTVLIGDKKTAWAIYCLPLLSTRIYKESKINFHIQCENYEEFILIKGLQISYKFYFLCQEGGQRFVSYFRELCPQNYFKPTFHGPCYGRISAEKLFNNYVIDKNVTILCELKIFAPEGLKITPMNPFQSICKGVFDQAQFTDFELRTSDGEALKAHKCILAIRSPVFNAMLKPQTKESQNNFVFIQDFDSKVMKEVLRFIYCNEVENLTEIANDLVFAAEVYGIDQLKDLCIESLVKTTVTENVVDLLITADLISDAKNLYENCLEFIISNFLKIKESEGWKHLQKDLKIKALQEIIEVNKGHVLIATTRSSVFPDSTVKDCFEQELNVLTKYSTLNQSNTS